MLKQEFIIRTVKGFTRVNGYVTEDGKLGIDKRDGGVWYITDIPTGLAVDNKTYKTRKAAVADIERLEETCKSKKLRESAKYKEAMAKLNEFKGTKTESEDKKMAKTNKSAKANTKAKANKPNEIARLEGENMALRAELEALRAQIAGAQPKAVAETPKKSPKAKAPKAPKVTIDTFDVAKYLESRDNQARITPELVKAFENTADLKVEMRGADGWLYIKGKNEESTRARSDIFKALGMRWSGREKAWFLAPYPLRSRKSWSAKKARATA